MLSGSEDIIRTNIPRELEPSLWPWPRGQQSKMFTQYSDTCWYITKPNLLAKSLKVPEIWEKVIFWGFALALWPWPWRSDPTFSHANPGHDDAQPYQVSWRKVLWLRRYRPNKYSLRIIIIYWTLISYSPVNCTGSPHAQGFSQNQNLTQVKYNTKHAHFTNVK